MVRFEIMKKFLFLILTIFLLCSCTKEEIKDKDLRYLSKNNLLGEVETIEEFNYDTSHFTDLKDIYNRPIEHKTYRYNKFGNIIEYKESCIIDEDEVDNIVTYTYNAKNLLVKVNTYESSGCITITKDYIYNDNNLLKEEISYCKDELCSKKEYSYNDNQSLKEIAVYRYDDINILQLKRRDKYSFKDGKQAIQYFEIHNKYIFKNGNEELNYKDFTAKYGNKADLSKWHIKIESDYERLYLTREIKYDSVHINKPKFLLVYASIYESDDMDAKFSRLDILEKSSIDYNEKGLIIDITRFTNFPFFTEISKYLYEYDRNGNWIKKIKCKKDNVESISKRIYTYFK